MSGDIPPNPAATGIPDRVESFVALGDSFTQGPGCPPEKRWADRLAAALRKVDPGLRFLNLAVDGATSEEVMDQVEEAAAMRPGLASVICGANDVLRSVRPDIDRYAANLNAMLDRLVEANPAVTLITATVPSNWHALEIRPRTKRRVIDSLKALNQRTREVAAGRGVALVDVESHPKLHEAGNFAPDGLHPSELGHERASGEFIRAVAELLSARRGKPTASRRDEDPRTLDADRERAS